MNEKRCSRASKLPDVCEEVVFTSSPSELYNKPKPKHSVWSVFAAAFTSTVNYYSVDFFFTSATPFCPLMVNVNIK